MSEVIRFTADTLDDAITQATMKFCVTSDHLGYDVIEKGAKGFLGIGAKKVVIDAWEMSDEEIQKAEAVKAEKTEAETVKVEEKKVEKKAVAPKEEKKEEKKAEKKEPVDESRFEEGKKFLESVFENMGMKVVIEYTYEEETLKMTLSGEDMGVLIGKRGQTLDSLQYLTSLVVNKAGGQYTRVLLDTENYRERRKETLESLAKNIAYKVKRTRKSVSLEPMNPYERRIIHSCLQQDNFVMTKSEGEEPYRHVVVFYKRNRNGEER